MTKPLNCWKCGSALSIPLPIGRRDECPSCATDLHVCVMCTFHDPAANKECREPMADEVGDRESGNFCDYFRPKPDAYRGRERAGADAAKAKLDRIFGGKAAPDPTQIARQAEAAKGKAQDDAAAARERLERLFGGKSGADKDRGQ